MVSLGKIVKEIQIEKFQIPEGWNEDEEIDHSDEQELWEGIILNSFWAPMEGWDENHDDHVLIIKKNNGTYSVDISYAFGNDTSLPCKTYGQAKKIAIKNMEDISSEWEDDNDGYFDDEDDEA